MEELEIKVKELIRDVNDFPRKGIVFKDITPLLANPVINNEILKAFVDHAKLVRPDVIVGIDSRGFLYGNIVAALIGVPFVPVRKEGKLPYDKLSLKYELEYGTATVEIHKDAILPKQRVLIHDDLLATGGTAIAASELVKMLGGDVIGYSFVVNLSFLPGAKSLKDISENLFSIVTY